jgi:hypothetical protein
MSDSDVDNASAAAPPEATSADFRWVHYGRIVAYWIDTNLVLGIPAKLVAVYWYDELVRFGIWNTVVALVLGVAYFTLLPRFVGGCTVGLFCIGARYVDREGKVPSIPRLAIRGLLMLSIFELPHNQLFTDGLGLFGSLAFIASLLCFGFYVYGGPNYRLPHEHLTGTWTAPFRFEGVPYRNEAGSLWNMRRFLLAVAVVAIWLGSPFYLFSDPVEDEFDELGDVDDQVEASLEAVPGVADAMVYAYSESRDLSVNFGPTIEIPPAFSVSIVRREALTESDIVPCFCAAAQKVLDTFPDAGPWETLDVDVSNRVEVLFAQVSDRYEASHSWEDWRGYREACEAGARVPVPYERIGILAEIDDESSWVEVLFYPSY